MWLLQRLIMWLLQRLIMWLRLYMHFDTRSGIFTRVARRLQAIKNAANRSGVLSLC